MFQAPQRCEGLKHFNKQNQDRTPGIPGGVGQGPHPCAGPDLFNAGQHQNTPSAMAVRPPGQVCRPDPPLPGSCRRQSDPAFPPGRPGVPTFSDTWPLVGPHGLTAAPQRGNRSQAHRLASPRQAQGIQDPGPHRSPSYQIRVGPRPAHLEPESGEPVREQLSDNGPAPAHCGPLRNGWKRVCAVSPRLSLHFGILLPSWQESPPTAGKLAHRVSRSGGMSPNGGDALEEPPTTEEAPNRRTTTEGRRRWD